MIDIHSMLSVHRCTHKHSKTSPPPHADRPVVYGHLPLLLHRCQLHRSQHVYADKYRSNSPGSPDSLRYLGKVTFAVQIFCIGILQRVDHLEQSNRNLVDVSKINGKQYDIYVKYIVHGSKNDSIVEKELSREQEWHRHKVKETIYIKQQASTMNRYSTSIWVKSQTTNQARPTEVGRDVAFFHKLRSKAILNFTQILQLSPNGPAW